MIRKLIAITFAILINCAALAWFHAWSASAVASAVPQPGQDKMLTLPVITVYPTRAQWESVRQSASTPQASSKVAPTGARGIEALVMPYYSFADQSTAADAG